MVHLFSAIGACERLCNIFGTTCVYRKTRFCNIGGESTAEVDRKAEREGQNMANQGGSSCRLRYRCAVIFDASQLRSLAKKTKDGPHSRWLLALAAIYDGVARTEAAKIGGVGLQIIRDWVLHFNERGPDGLLNGKSPGQPSKLNDVQRQAIARVIESGPIPAVHGVVRWRLIDLAQWIFEEFRITIAKQTLSRELRAMGYRRLSARPRHHAQAEGAIENFKKVSPPVWRQSREKKRSTAKR